jgi:nitrogen PTS system EIIA component
MNSIAQLFAANDVLLDLDVANKQMLFEAVGKLWEEQHGIGAAAAAAGLSERENLGSTGLGEGMAIPHARVAGLSEAVAAFVRLKSPIDFDAPDGKPVGCCFLLLAPAQAAKQHLQILADVAEMPANPQFRDLLAAAKDSDEVHRLFASWRPAKDGKPT